MSDLLSIADNALIQGLSYGIAALGVALAFRVLRFPDLTADGGFLVGASLLAALLSSGTPWIVACAAAVIVGASAGLVTGLLTIGGVNRLLAGILTSMGCYSLAFRVLGNRSNVGLLDVETPFSLVGRLDAREPFASMFLHPGTLGLLLLVGLLVAGLLYAVLRSDLGLLLRAVGGNPALVDSLGRPTGPVILLGLAAANGLAGLAGALVASQQGFADANMGAGIVITLIAGLVLGEEAGRRARLEPGGLVGAVVAPFLGMCVYYGLYLSVLRASVLGLIPLRIQPTDLRLLSALVLASAIALRSRRPGAEAEVLPI